jgi:hypothetical protein
VLWSYLGSSATGSVRMRRNPPQADFDGLTIRPNECLIADMSCRRGRLSRSRSDVSSLIRSNYGSVRERGRVYRAAGHTLPDSPPGIDSDSPIQLVALRRAPVCLFLSPLVLAFLVYGRPETVPSISPVSVKSAGALAALNNTALNVAV